jgi:NAD(P)-dependent dehydrogenase (short-subunit alcohol dehydrogenase family)
MSKLHGKIAVVTGGAAGMGRATAALFASEGARVVLADIDEAAAEAAARNIAGADAVRCDITKVADLDALRAHVEAVYGRVDIVFANAGGGRGGMFEQVSEEDFDFTVATNFKGTFFTVSKLVPLMGAGGSIIMNASIQASKAFPGFAVYAATKAAIRSLARAFAAELGPKGIRANALAPGYINTDIRRRAGMSEEMIKEDDLRAQGSVPLGRIGTVEEVAKAVLFLASDDSSYITGVEFAIDGGVAQV